MQYINEIEDKVKDYVDGDYEIIETKAIPSIDIYLTGVRISSGEVYVNLSSADSIGNLSYTDSLNMKSNYNINEKSDYLFKSKYLSGDNLGKGRYKVFINCTNLSSGYYELEVTYIADKNPQYNDTSPIERYSITYETVTHVFYLTYVL